MKLSKKINIAIDGPAGVGKTTVARGVARLLGYTHVDTGYFYRALTYKAILRKVDVKNPQQLSKLIVKTKIKYSFRKNKDRIFLDGKDVTSKIRSQQVNKSVSYLACFKDVRKLVVKMQKELAKDKGVVMEGRDIGSNVLPGAILKIFLNASLEERVRRRYEELKGKNSKICKCEVRNEIRERDILDCKRKYGSLKKVKSAVKIDTTGMSSKEVIAKIVGLAKNIVLI